MKKSMMQLLVVGLLVAGSAIQSNAYTIVAGDYRLSISQAVTHLTNPGDLAVSGRIASEQGDQWAIARVGTLETRDQFNIFTPIWTPGTVIPNPPPASAPPNMYISAVMGGLTLQTDPLPAALGVAPAVNTGLTYNERQHPVGDTAPPSGTGLPHPLDYVTNNVTSGVPDPHKSFYVADGLAYLKIYGTPTDVFSPDVAAGAGTSGAFGAFGANTIAGTLLLDLVFDPTALFIADGTGDSMNSLGSLGLLRAFSTSSTETGVLAYFQTTGFGAWDALFDSNSANFFGADGQIDFTAQSLIGSPYQPPGPGQTPDPMAVYGWDFRDVGQGLVTVPGAVPEPSTLFLLGIGLLGLGAYGRKRIKL